MKKLILFFIAAFFSMAVLSQGNKGGKGKSKENPSVVVGENDRYPGQNGKSKNKEKDKDKDKDKVKDKENDKENEEKSQREEHDRKIWDGVTGDEKCGKSSKNQPAKVRSSFQRDYPNAVNARWAKCRGDWTATFRNGIFNSTAVYHANGERRDTRTPITQKEMPKVTLDSIFKRRPKINLGDIIKIEKPGSLEEIFRLKDASGAGTEFLFFNKLGELIKYDY